MFFCGGYNVHTDPTTLPITLMMELRPRKMQEFGWVWGDVSEELVINPQRNHNVLMIISLTRPL